MTIRVIDQVDGLYRVLALNRLRETPGVVFDSLMLAELGDLTVMDRVVHSPGAISPGSVGDIARPWYMHTAQADNLIVLHGARYVDLYTPAHGRVESFVVTPGHIEHDGRVITGAAMLVWPTGVFHRVRSDEKLGSASVNLAVHVDGFDIRHNFSIYDVNTDAGTHRVIREGHLDQPS
ncbi:MAG: hypothetical protein ACYTFO_09955 [Planctomycetota bacterium]|jgi:hypothetical protein